MRLSLIYLKKKNSVDWFWLLQVRCEFGRAEMSQCYLDKQVLKILLIIQPVSLQRIAGLHHHWSYSEILSHLYYMLNVIRTVEVWPTSPYALGLFCWGRTLVGIQLFIWITLMRCAAKNSSSSETSVQLAFFHPLQPLHLLFTGLRWWKSICQVLFFPDMLSKVKITLLLENGKGAHMPIRTA